MLIFDEAHNIEQQCEDAASVVISSLDLAGCLEDITKVMQWMIDSQSATTASVDENDENNFDANGNLFTDDYSDSFFTTRRDSFQL